MDNQLDLIHWVGRRTHAATQICNVVVTNLVVTNGVAPAEDVAAGLSAVLGKEYTAVDVRMMLGSSTGPEETAALLHVSNLFRRFDNKPIDHAVKILVDEGQDEQWVYYVADYLREVQKYQDECRDVLDAYRKALAALPEFVEGQDLTETVAFPDRPGQHPDVNAFIDKMIEHFTIRPGLFCIPSPEVWPLSKYIVVRTVEKEDGVVACVPTPKGIIVLNASPI